MKRRTAIRNGLRWSSGRRVLPAFTKGVREIADGRAPHLDLDVVPRRSGAVAVVELDRLVIAGVAARRRGDRDTDRCRPRRQRRRRVRAAPDDDQLLVMAAAAPHPLVEDDLASRLVDHLGQRRVALLGEVRLTRVRSPQQPADLHTASSGIGEDATDLGARSVEELVAVALPIREDTPQSSGSSDDNASCRRPKYSAPSTSTSTRFPRVHAAPSPRRRSIVGRRVSPLRRGQEPIIEAQRTTRAEPTYGFTYPRSGGGYRRALQPMLRSVFLRHSRRSTGFRIGSVGYVADRVRDGEVACTNTSCVAVRSRTKQKERRWQQPTRPRTPPSAQRARSRKQQAKRPGTTVFVPKVARPEKRRPEASRREDQGRVEVGAALARVRDAARTRGKVRATSRWRGSVDVRNQPPPLDRGRRRRCRRSRPDGSSASCRRAHRCVCPSSTSSLTSTTGCCCRRSSSLRCTTRRSSCRASCPVPCSSTARPVVVGSAVGRDRGDRGAVLAPHVAVVVRDAGDDRAVIVLGFGRRRRDRRLARCPKSTSSCSTRGEAPSRSDRAPTGRSRCGRPSPAPVRAALGRRRGHRSRP